MNCLIKVRFSSFFISTHFPYQLSVKRKQFRIFRIR
uniref:Uncharacterized protein n=1 Tax=Medicago truncatula TaxID=3880 RepID=I3SFQ5_MEDTR|nr:unknown [Medicago truncatula]